MTSPEPLPPVNLMMSALWWASKGIAVLPLHHPVDGHCSCRLGSRCDNPAKHPIAELVRHGLSDASTDPEQVRDWWVQKPYANIGIRTGETVDLLDIDSTDGLTAFARIVEQAGGMPLHLGVAQSGRDGFGQHIYVAPGGMRALSGGRTAPPGIDVKGRGGYAVAPPSLHISGRRYAWTVNGFDSGALLGDVDWSQFHNLLMVRPAEPPRGPRPTTTIPADAADAYGRAVLTRAVALVDHAATGNRWQTLATEAVPLVARGVDGGCIDRDSAVRELQDATRRAGLTATETARVGPLVDDMIAKGIRHPIRPREAARELAPAPEYDTEDEARADPWDPPWPLRHPTPPFPIEVMGWMAAPCIELAEQLQTPVDLIAMMTLAAVSATIRGRARVQITDSWDEPLNLYIAAVLGPGETKSPALARILAPLREMEAEARQKATETAFTRQFDRDLLLDRAKRLRDTAVRVTGGPAEVALAQEEARQAALDAERVTVPPVPLWLAGDMTPEALVAKLAEQGGALAHISAEGELLDTIVGGRYSSGAPHLSSLLTAHDGREPVRVHRKRDADLEVLRPCLTLGLAVQPHVLQQMGEVDAAVRRGLAARFLYSVPASLVGRRDMTVHRAGDVGGPFERLLRGVDGLVAAATADRGSEVYEALDRGSGERSAGPRALGSEGIEATIPKKLFLESSYLLVTHYRESLEPRRAAETGDLGEIGPWANKLDGQVCRLAAVLQLVRDADPASRTPCQGPQNPHNLGSVGVDATSAALVLADYLIAHAIEAHAVMTGAGAGHDNDRARQLLGWIRRHTSGEFTERDAQQSLRRRVTFRDQDAVHDTCTTLVRLGWIRLLPHEPRPGRPSTRYLVHPDVYREGRP